MPRKVNSCAIVNCPLPDCLFFVTALGPPAQVGLFFHSDTRLENSMSAGLFLDLLACVSVVRVNILTAFPGVSQQKKDAPVMQRKVSVAIGVFPGPQFPLQKKGTPSLLP